MIRVVLDTNILISALLSPQVSPGQVFLMTIIDPDTQLCVCRNFVARRDWHLAESLSLWLPGCLLFPPYRSQFRASQTAERYLAISIFSKFQSRLTTKFPVPSDHEILDHEILTTKFQSTSYWPWHADPSLASGSPLPCPNEALLKSNASKAVGGDKLPSAWRWTLARVCNTVLCFLVSSV
jgi:hypothetical protein